MSPHATDAVVDRSALTELRGVAERLHASEIVRVVVGEQVTDLPAAVGEAVRDLLDRFAGGESVVIGSTRTLLTTSQVADFLGVSRTFVVKLIEEGELGFEYRGTHRRVSLPEAVRYLEESRHDRRRTLDAIAELTERTGGYDSDPF